jgi:hypothetical protein
MSDDIAARLAALRAEIDAAARAAGREPSSVRLVAVSKGQPAAALRAAWNAGQREFGENYASEMTAKQAALAELDDVVWHFVGRVQRGNARAIATAALVHGVGSLSQAQALDKEAARRATALPVLLQVNLVDEQTKNGFSAAELVNALPALRTLRFLRLRGLMAMPAVDDAALPAAFAAVRRLRDDACADLDELSMGMSADFAAAIAAGATIVRVGTRIFGPRSTTPTETAQGGGEG